MATHSRIPSPEDIALLLKRRELGVKDTYTPVEASKAEELVDSLENKVRALEYKVHGPKTRRSAKELQEAMLLLGEKYNFDAAEELIQIAISLKNIPEQLRLRVHVLQDLMSYTMPKLKSVEITGEVEHNHSVTIVRYGDDGVIKQEKLSNPVNQTNVIDIVASPAKEVEAKVTVREEGSDE